MRNSISITSDLSTMVLVDSKSSNNHLSIGKRGVLLSVLGTDVVATEVASTLDNHIKTVLRGKKPFYEFEIADEEKNQLCISYNEGSNTVFIIGVTDVIAERTGPTALPKEKTQGYMVKLKDKPETGLASSSILLARLEATRGMGSKKFIRFYYVEESPDT
ncbi:MAG: hypothetical protein AAFZ15_08995 [Bacteroidota bacterium]